MSEDVAGGEAPFDLDRLRELIELMEKHGLTDVSLSRGDEKWRLRRGSSELVQTISYPAAAVPPAVAPVPASSPAAPQPQVPAEPESDETVLITSPTIGTFYTSPTPDDPPFVTIGKPVQPDTIVCIVEAMKVFNQIPAEVSGTIVEVLVKNGDAVEFGQPLFRVRPG